METSALQLPSAARFLPKRHSRAASRSPTRPRLIDDILSDLSPQTTLDAFTSASGTLKASIENASPTQRAFGIRAAVASKKIYEWVDELVSWPWPAGSCQGFEIPVTRRRRLSKGSRLENARGSLGGTSQDEAAIRDDEYWGCLPAQDVLRYESRVDEILEDMEDLDVEEIKRQILDTHILPKTRPSSGLDQQPDTLSPLPYTAMDDFTAVVTATVIQALPKLSRLMGLLNVWSVRLAVLRQVPSFVTAIDNTELALKQEWEKLQTFSSKHKKYKVVPHSERPSLPRLDFETMRDLLQDKVGALGQQIDQMLDSLEGRQETLPEAWLDRMEAIEKDYGEWNVRGERFVREGEWAKDAAQQLEKKKVAASKVAEVNISAIKGSSQSVEESRQVVRENFLVEQSARCITNEHANSSKGTEGTVTHPPSEITQHKKEKSPHVENGSNLSSPVTPQTQPSETKPLAQTTPPKTNGQSPPTRGQLGNESMPLSHQSGPSEADKNARRSSKPFQAGFSWYLTHGEGAITTPPMSSKSPIAEVLAPPSKSFLDGPKGAEEIEEPVEKQRTHKSPKDEGVCSKPVIEKGNERDSMKAEKPISGSAIASISTDERPSSKEAGPVDLSSSTDGIFELGLLELDILNETAAAANHHASKNSRGSTSSPRPSQTDSIGGYLSFLDSQLSNSSVIPASRPAKIPRFGSGVANSLRWEAHPRILTANTNSIPQRSSPSVKKKVPTNDEVDVLAQSKSSPNGAAVATPDVGQPPSSISLPPASAECVPDVHKSSQTQKPTNQLGANLVMEVPPPEQSPQEIQSIESTKLPSPDVTADIHSKYTISLGSNATNIESAEVSTATGDEAFDLSEAKFASTGDSDAEYSGAITSVNNPPVKPHVNPIEQVVKESEAGHRELPPAHSADSVAIPKSTVPVGDTSDSQIFTLPTIESSELGKPVISAPSPIDSEESNIPEVSTAPIVGNSPPKECGGSYGPSTQVPPSTEPAIDDPPAPTTPKRRVGLHVFEASLVNETESISEPLVATSLVSLVHKPLDVDHLQQSNQNPVAVLSANQMEPDIAEAGTSSPPTVPQPNFLPSPVESGEEAYFPTIPVSTILDPSTSSPAPEIAEADHSENVLSIPPVEIPHINSGVRANPITTTEPTVEATLVASGDSKSDSEEIDGSQTTNSKINSSIAQLVLHEPETVYTSSPDEKAVREISNVYEAEDPSHSRKSSASSVIVHRTVDGLALLPPEHSFSDLSPTTEASNSSTETPVMVLSSDSMYQLPTVDRKSTISLIEYDEDSPSTRRSRPQHDIESYSPPASPMPEMYFSKHRLPQLEKSLSFESDSSYLDDTDVAEAPLISNVEVSPAPPPSSLVKTSDDQLQQQISEILDSIPARIRLSSDPDTNRTSKIPKLKKQASRASLNPHPHPPVSRAPTPSFTLAPAYAKNPRPRPQNANSEIKLYHLSRSNDEAPIKLFVRLVGEKGERVMVRVGGGWADLGEYLKEYANHHGRRSDKEGKVEIQDLPSRVVSSGSNASTIRNRPANRSGTCSPISRPTSSLDRPMSSLAVRKTRKSVGEEARGRSYRSPSTPLPNSFRGSPTVPRALETPPSAASRSVSRLSWTEEESALGLAGPKSRKVEISAENAAWVESMKEKVRIASAEKEREKKPDFGEMDRAGATKRLFKKGT